MGVGQPFVAVLTVAELHFLLVKVNFFSRDLKQGNSNKRQYIEDFVVAAFLVLGSRCHFLFN